MHKTFPMEKFETTWCSLPGVAWASSRVHTYTEYAEYEHVSIFNYKNRVTYFLHVFRNSFRILHILHIFLTFSLHILHMYWNSLHIVHIFLAYPVHIMHILHLGNMQKNMQKIMTRSYSAYSAYSAYITICRICRICRSHIMHILHNLHCNVDIFCIFPCISDPISHQDSEGFVSSHANQESWTLWRWKPIPGPSTSKVLRER